MLPGNGSILKKSPFRPETGEKERVPAFAGTLQKKEERRSNSPRCGADVVAPGEGEAKNEKAISLIFCA